MKTITISFVLWGLFSPLSIASAEDKTFNRYQSLSKSLSEKESKVISFINENNYLSDRLRNLYLNYLYKNNKWDDYLTFYRANGKTHQYCQYLTVYYHQTEKSLALEKIATLWQEPKALPKSCNKLITLWQESDKFDESLRFKKFKALMLAKEITLAKKLSKEMNDDDKKFATLWLSIHRNPYRIKTPKNLADPRYKDILAYGLKQWAKRSPDGAAKQWKVLKEQYKLSDDHKQLVFETIALYAALRDNEKTESYFKELTPAKTPTLHQEWQARYALKKEKWGELKLIIEDFPDDLKEKSCWQYWLARSYEKLDNPEKATELYQVLAKSRNYYGFLASFRLDEPVDLNQQNYEYDKTIIEPHLETISEIKRLYKNDKIYRASLLSYELSNDLSDEELYLFAKELGKLKWHHKALYYTNKSKHLDDLELRFPLGYKTLIEKNAKTYQVDPAFIFAIIRQESTFRQKVKSHAGALGLMQVIPSTARRMAKKYKVPLKNMRNMYKAKTNLRIGTAYLKHLNQRFNQHPILVAAAYNAGPNQVKKWLRSQENVDVDLWVETLPWHETRNYLKNVMAFFTIYHTRLGYEDTPLWFTPITVN